jgi:hypothetical protein
MNGEQTKRILRTALAVACLALAGTAAGAGIDYATYLGGTGDEAEVWFGGAVGLARDDAGNRYLTGTTRSTDFPTTPGADRTLDGDADVFVTKVRPDGSVAYSTYLGGGCDDFARDVAVDAAGNAYVTGQVNGGGLCTATPGVLVAKLDPNGNVIYASRIGGSLLDSSYGTAIAVDGAGHAYVTGAALTTDFPTTPGALQTVACPNPYPFAGDGFVAKLSLAGDALIYSTLLCGAGDDLPADIAVDAAGNAYVAGATASSDFPLVEPLDATRGGGVVGLSGFVSKLAPDGSHLVYSTFLGGTETSVVNALAIDAAGSAYVTGETIAVDFPTTPGVLQASAGRRFCIQGCSDAFVSKIAPSGSSLVYSTYLYGELDDRGAAIAVDGAGNAHVVGTTFSLYFPVLDAFQPSNHGLDDAFVVQLNADGTRLVHASYLGGGGPGPATGGDVGSAIALDGAGNADVALYTLSPDLPTTPGAFQPALGDGVCDVLGTVCGDGFLAHVVAGGPGAVPPVRLGVDASDAAPGMTVTATWDGNTTPTADDYLRLFPLGGSTEDLGDAPIHWWPTPNAGRGQLVLQLPADLPLGTYELRLFSPPLGSVLPIVVARSAPIRVASAVPPPPGGPCDDGDPCTEDASVAGVGCVSTPASGIASVTCTCARAVPATCGGQVVPPAIGSRRQRVCELFADAAGAPRRAVAARLRRAVQTLGGSIRLVAKASRKGVSAACAGALKDELRDAKRRTMRLLRS